MEDKNTTQKRVKDDEKHKKVTLEEGKIIELIVFNLADEEFGADIEQVREIIRIEPITPIPDSPDFIEGVTNVRGEIAVVVNLKARFLLPTEEEVEEKHIVITEQEKTLFGLKVDEVTEVLRIPETDIKPTPELVTRIEEKYVKGVITLENRLIIMLDLNNVLSEEELARLTELSRKHRAIAETKKRKPQKEREKKKKEEKETTAKLPETEEIVSEKQTPTEAKSSTEEAGIKKEKKADTITTKSVEEDKKEEEKKKVHR